MNATAEAPEAKADVSSVFTATFPPEFPRNAIESVLLDRMIAAAGVGSSHAKRFVDEWARFVIDGLPGSPESSPQTAQSTAA